MNLLSTDSEMQFVSGVCGTNRDPEGTQGDPLYQSSVYCLSGRSLVSNRHQLLSNALKRKAVVRHGAQRKAVKVKLLLCALRY